MTHLSPETPSDLERLISQFAELPDVQKQRFLLLLDSTKPSQKAGAPKPSTPDAPPKKAGGTEGGNPKTSGAESDVLPVVKSSLDLLSTALKGLLGATKNGGKKDANGSPKGTTPDSHTDESDLEEQASPSEDEDSDSSADDASSMDDETSPSQSEDLMGSDSEREPD